MLKYSEVGEKWTHSGEQRAVIEKEVEHLEWHQLADGLQGPMAPVLCLQGIMEEVKGRHVAVAWNGVYMDRYGLLGLETRYRDGACRSYWLDTGVEATALCHEFIPKGKELIYEWLRIGNRNPWIHGATDPFFDECSFCECQNFPELAENLGRSNWCEGTAFYFEDICFINQDRGGHEWLVIHKGVAFESLSGWAYGPDELGRLMNFVDRVQKATREQLLSLDY